MVVLWNNPALLGKARRGCDPLTNHASCVWIYIMVLAGWRGSQPRLSAMRRVGVRLCLARGHVQQQVLLLVGEVLVKDRGGDFIARHLGDVVFRLAHVVLHLDRHTVQATE